MNPILYPCLSSVLSIAFGMGALAADARAQGDVFWPSNVAKGDNFGIACDRDGSRLVVGADQSDSPFPGGVGKAYVYELVGATWTETAELHPSDGAPGDRFGAAVAIDGNTIAVGANEAGVTYVFELQSGTWTETAKLVGAGGTVSLSGDFLVTGVAVFSGVNGDLEVYERQGTSWVLDFLPQGLTGAVDGDRLIVGDPTFMFSVGEVSIYDRVGDRWMLDEKINVQSPVGQEYLGWQVYIAGDVVGMNLTLGGQGSVNAFRIYEHGSTGWDLKLSQSEASLQRLTEKYARVGFSTYARHAVQDSPNPAWREVPETFNAVGSGASSRIYGQDWTFQGTPGFAPLGLTSAGGMLAFPSSDYPYAEHYCTAKQRNATLQPQIQGSGSASLSVSFKPLSLEAKWLPANKNGLLFYGLDGSTAVPFLGGTLCVQPPLRRTTIQNSGDLGFGYGELQFDLKQWILDGNEPNLAAGDDVHGQFWFRDDADPLGIGLTDATRVVLAP